MDRLKLFVTILIISLVSPSYSLVVGDLTVSSTISSSDKARLINAFSEAWKLNNVSLVHYALVGHKILNEPVPLQVKDICQYLVRIGESSKTLEQLYHVAASWHYLPACKDQLPIKKLNNDLISKMEMTHENVFYIHFMKKYLGESVQLPDKKMPKLPTQSNELTTNFGYMLHVASVSSDAETSTQVYNKIAAVVSHADELDGKYLQYDGGLAVTAFIISGIYRLSEARNTPPPLTDLQLIKFTNYLLSRSTVNRPKGAYHLLEALNILVNNKFHALASVECASKSIPINQPTLSVRVSDLFGNALFWGENVKMVITAEANGFKHTLLPSDEKTVYKMNLKESSKKFGIGYYDVKILVAVQPDDKKSTLKKSIVNPTNNVISYKITTDVTFQNVQIGFTDSDHSSSQSALKSLNYPHVLNDALKADSSHRFVAKFSLKTYDGEFLRCHQAFVRFTHVDKEQEFTFIPTYDPTNQYRLQIDLKTSAKTFEYLSGQYDITILIADSLITTPIVWAVAKADLKFPSVSGKLPKDYSFASYYQPKPNIQHTFREPDKRPATIVSNVFTILVLTPAVILFILWIKLGVNMKNFPFTISAIGFHIGLGSIFGLFGLFWLKLNMFETIRYLFIIGIVTFLCGNKMLTGIASARTSK